MGEALRFFKLKPADLVVFYDEIDMAPGRFRMKTGGGAAGHNGIRSIIAQVGADFRRARLGVGHPGEKELVHGHVLSDFAKAEHELGRAADLGLRRRAAPARRGRGRDVPERGAAPGARAQGRPAPPRPRPAELTALGPHAIRRRGAIRVALS